MAQVTLNATHPGVAARHALVLLRQSAGKWKMPPRELAKTHHVRSRRDGQVSLTDKIRRQEAFAMPLDHGCWFDQHMAR